MKHKYLKFITVFSLFAILALQVLWLINTYFLVKGNISREVNEVLLKSLDLEAMKRFEETPDTIKIEWKATLNDIQKIVYLEEELYKLGYPVSIEKVDSIASSLLELKKIKTQLIVQLVSLDDNVILQKSTLSDSWNFIESDIIPIRMDSSQGIQIKVLSPYKIFFERMIFLLVTTFVILIFALYGLFYQIKIIITERKVNQMKEDFSYAIIHDMKTPVNTIMACVKHLYTNELDKNPDFKSNLLIMVDNSIDLLLSFINKSLTLFSLESGKLKVEKERFSLIVVIDELKKIYLTQNVKPIHFIINLKTEMIIANRQFLKVSISNLIDNSIKYSENELEIIISSESNEEYDIIKVRDNGIGISQKDQKVIFEKFERASAARRTLKNNGPSGFGLGLSYVSQVIQAHGGKVTLTSIEGEFTEISLYLPKIMEEL